MVLLGAAVNAAAIFIGAAMGMLFKKGIPERVQKTLTAALGLCVLFIGIQGALAGEALLIEVLSLVLGALLGEWIDLDRHLNRFGAFLQKKLTKNDQSSFGEAFVSSTLFVCVGAMAIVGAIEAGMQGKFDTYYTKALLDGVTVLIFTSSLGFGCFFSGVVLFVYEGALSLAAKFVSAFLTEAMITEMSAVGSILILAIGLNLLNVTKIKVANLLPAAFLPILFCLFIR